MKNILVVQTAFLGDVVLVTPLLEALKERFPQARIAVVTTPTGGEILQGNPVISEIIVYDKKVTQRGWLNFLRVVRQIRERQFDLAVLPHRSMRTSLLAYLAGIPVRLGFENSIAKFLLTQSAAYLKARHEVERNLELAYSLGAQRKQIKPKVYLSQEEDSFAREFLAANGVSDGFLVGLNPGSVWATKRWLPEGFAQVGDRLTKDYNTRVIVFGSAKEAEIGQQVIKNMKHTPISAIGQTNLKQLTALIKRCYLFVTNDSGPMHLAMAVATPTVAIFGPTTTDIGFGPYGEKAIVVERKGLKCRPCGLHGPKKCPQGHFACMKEISPDEVIKAATSLGELKSGQVLLSQSTA